MKETYWIVMTEPSRLIKLAYEDDVGFVVIGRNEGVRLQRCFESLSRYRNSTIVYVDSGSTDGSVVLARCFNYGVVNLNLDTPFTAARARNAGFSFLTDRLSTCRYIQFLDGDCELMEGWVQSGVNFLDRHIDVAIVCGRRREKYADASVYNRLADMEWNTPVGETKSCGGDSLVRKEAFEQVEGFNPVIMAGEEPDLCSRLIKAGWKIWRIDAEMSLHDADMHKFKQWWMRGTRAGYAIVQVSMLRNASTRYWRDILRALFWAVAVPLFILVGTFFSWVAVAISLVYLMQILRVQQHVKAKGSNAWMYATFVVLENFPRLFGATKYFWDRAMRKKQVLVEYKSR